MHAGMFNNRLTKLISYFLRVDYSRDSMSDFADTIEPSFIQMVYIRWTYIEQLSVELIITIIGNSLPGDGFTSIESSVFSCILSKFESLSGMASHNVEHSQQNIFQLWYSFSFFLSQQKTESESEYCILNRIQLE